MPRQNRVDPWSDLNAVAERGLFTGNRGCLVDGDRKLARHHNGSLWITCLTSYRGWWHPLDQPRIWTPIFFLDDAVALAAGHRPCGLCRRADYLDYRAAVTEAVGADSPVLAVELNRRLAAERLNRGRGINRARDRKLWTAYFGDLPTGTVVLIKGDETPHLINERHLQPFTFGGWGPSVDPRRRREVEVDVLTPPTSVDALRNGFTPHLHPSASNDL